MKPTRYPFRCGTKKRPSLGRRATAAPPAPQQGDVAGTEKPSRQGSGAIEGGAERLRRGGFLNRRDPTAVEKIAPGGKPGNPKGSPGPPPAATGRR